MAGAPTGGLALEPQWCSAVDRTTLSQYGPILDGRWTIHLSSCHICAIYAACTCICNVWGSIENRVSHEEAARMLTQPAT